MAERNLEQGDVSGLPDNERYVGSFWDRVARGEDCWLWTGAVKDTGYGVVWREGRPAPAHRVAWELIHGPVPAGLRVLHTCDVRACVRPDHLWLGTSAENTADMDRKGRRTHRQPRVRKLTPGHVRAIRRLHAHGEKQTEIAEWFGVTNIAIWKVVHGRTWSDLPPEEPVA